MYDSLKGADLGDELYVEGMDDAFLEWRAQHGQEWARYYGLTVRPLLNNLPAAPRWCLPVQTARGLTAVPSVSGHTWL